MIDRRTWITGVGVTIVVARADAQSSGRAWRVGVLRPGPDDAVFRENFRPFRRTLQASGIVEGRNLSIDYRVRPGTLDELVALARDLVRQRPDAILAIGPAGVRAAAAATTSVPIVAVDLESDPVAEGFVASLARPGGNVTGLFLDVPELAGKWIEILREAVPRLIRIAVLWDPSTGRNLVRGAETAAQTMPVQLVLLEARTQADLANAFDGATDQRAGGMLVLSSPVFNSARARIAELAAKRRLPAIMPFPGFVDDGGLVAYGPDVAAMYAQAAEVMVKVLLGTRPGVIPVERPARFEFAVNLRTAKSLGVTIPPSLLVRADRVIE